jgi:hypothetical protein
MHARDQPEQCSLAASVAAQDSPTIAFPNREGYFVEYPGCAELDTSIRD